MNLIQEVLLDYQYHKYVRQMPFYMVRHFGIKRNYLPSDVEFVVRRYHFDTEYSFIGYAMFCRSNSYHEATSAFESWPTRDNIRKKISNKYFHGKEEFTLKDLMKLSSFKSTWPDWAAGAAGDIDPAVPNDEYWQAMDQFHKPSVDREQFHKPIVDKISKPEQPSDSDEEWEAHYQSLDTEVLLDLLASNFLLHRKMFEEILAKRGITQNDIRQTIENRKEIREKAVSVSKSIESASRDKWSISSVLIVCLIVLVVLGLYLVTRNDIVLYLVIGAVMGGFAGFIGGFIGGGISGYFDPITRWTVFDTAGRLGLAKGGAESAAVSGAAAGLIVGGIVGVVGDVVSPLILFVCAGVIFWLFAVWQEHAVGESIMGYPGGVVVGAIFGVLGGYAGRYVATLLFGLS